MSGVLWAGVKEVGPVADARNRRQTKSGCQTSKRQPSIADVLPMRNHSIALVTAAALLATNAFAESTELWFGTYTDEEGVVQQGRYRILRDGNAIVQLTLEPYGHKAAVFDIVENDTAQRFVKLKWPGDTARECLIIQYNDTYYSGNCVKGTKVLPLAIKRFDFQDAQRQGNWFGVSDIELEILTHAERLLHSSAAWSRTQERVCDDTARYSLFCALHAASLAVDGEYRHLRPAVKAVREAIERIYPDRYDHVLADFNNAPETTLSDVHKVIRHARDELELRQGTD
ncbi:MAG: hypothetical protein AAGF72_07995 [Pseudomonadota bacterium]